MVSTSHRVVAGNEVGNIGFGCMGLSWAYGAAEGDRRAKAAVIEYAVDSGATFLDTSDAYGPFTNEELVGDVVRSRGAEVTVSTKVGLVPADGWLRPDGRPEHIRRACDASLARLGVDAIDLYHLHRVDPDVPLVESWGALGELVVAGKVRHIGLCEVTIEQLDEANAVHPVSSVQSELSIWARDALDEVVPWCERNGAAFVAYAPLGRGYLAGSINAVSALGEDDFRARNPRFTPEARAANGAIVRSIEEVADRHDATTAQVALAWLLHVSNVVVPIPGTTKPGRVAENVASAAIRLSSDEVDFLGAIPQPVQARY